MWYNWNKEVTNFDQATRCPGRFMSKDFDQTEAAPRKFELGPLGNLNQVTKGLAKTIRAMADGTLDSQVGARICNGLGIMRMCFETQKLEELEVRMGEISRVVGARPAIPAPLSIDHETYGSSH